MASLPRPVTTTDTYLAAILEELRAVREKLDRLQPLQGQPESGEVELREPRPLPPPMPAVDFEGKPPKKGRQREAKS